MFFFRLRIKITCPVFGCPKKAKQQSLHQKNMKSNFQINPISGAEFQLFFNLSEKELAKSGIVKMIVDEYPGFPCRVTLEDAKIGEEVILFPFEHHSTDSPYQASGPIFIRKNVVPVELAVNEIPPILKHRFLSLRGYDQTGIMKAAVTTWGKDLANEIGKIFDDNRIEYIHVHNANPGCFNCEIRRHLS